MPHKIIIICGPTAVGKSLVGLRLAAKFNGEIVNADSAQVWRGLDIGTAKHPSFTVPHHLIDVANPDEHFDAARFVDLADKAIADISRRGRVPFVVGGTGMYLRMLVHGLCSAPPRDSFLRASLMEDIKKSGIESLYKRLEKVDPVTAKVIHHHDQTRIIRALEIYESTGVTASDFYERHRFDERRYDALKIGLAVPRDELYQRINERVLRMLSSGWVEEVKGLTLKYTTNCQAFSAIGYKEVALHIEGKLSFDEMVGRIQMNSRRYAKRQMTWFRADKEVKWFTPSQLLEIEGGVKTFLTPHRPCLQSKPTQR